MLTADTTVTWSPRRDSNARPSPYRREALPLELRRHVLGSRVQVSNRLPSPYERDALPGELQRHELGHELGNQGSNRDSLASGASVLPGYTIPHQLGKGPVRRQGFEPRTLPIKSRML